LRLFVVIGAGIAVAALAANGASAPAPVATTQAHAAWSIPARQTASHAVGCARGFTATGGEVVSGPPGGQLLFSGPSGARSWQFRLANYGGQDAELSVVVTCVRVRQPGGLAAATSSQAFRYARPQSHTFAVGCGQGLAPTGLGYTLQPLRPPPRALPPTPRTHVRFATIRPERRRWIVHAESHGDPLRLTIHARCARRVTRGRSLIVARSDRRLRVEEGRNSIRRRCPGRSRRLFAGYSAGIGVDVVTVPQRDGSAEFRVFNTGPGRRPVTLHLLCLAPRTS
jgi:hypothetical protein